MIASSLLTLLAGFAAALPANAGASLFADPASSDDASPIAEAMATADAALAQLIAVPAGERTVANTLLAIDDAVAQLFEDARIVGFMADVSTDPAERARARDAQSDLSNWFDRLAKNEEVFRAVTELEELHPEMNPEESRYFEETMRDYKRAGLDLPEDQRERLVEIDERLNELGSDFRKNIAEDGTTLFFTAEELEGVPESFTGSMKRCGDLYMADMKGPSLRYILGYCEVETSRKKMGAAASLRGGQRNVEILEELIHLRHERATMLGYPTTAAYVLETKMAKTPEAVFAFYEDLRPKVRVKAEEDFNEFETAKREHLNDPDAQLVPTDVSFYTNWLKRKKYSVDTRTLREYFPMEAVTEGMFGVYQELFGITFREITAEARGERPMWHEDVRLFQVFDNASNAMLGEFYLDLFPRDGKFRRAAQFPLRLRKSWPDGRISTPLVALVCNFTRPTEDLPSLMSHREVKTFFHEFGHCLHSLLTTAGVASLAGTNVPRDFVEAPSQMLENWTWQPEILGRFAKHYETGEPLPPEIIEGMIAAKNLGAGFNNEGQIYLGLMDMRFHTDEDGIVDTTKVCEETYAEVRMFKPAANLLRQASFGHLVGYQAGYYGYLWSAVYAQDMWSRFEANPMDTDIAAEYRRSVLAPGGTCDALDMVKEFLGREPNGAAFLKHLGL